ncbi:MAG: CAF17-like 4Fe-4S cluster assembly/insertion protein YgfZ [Anaplasma sp.]
MKLFWLKDRSVLRVYGPDARQFMHNITTNDVPGVTAQRSIYNLMLNSRGRYMFDFFLIPHGRDLLLDCARVDAQELTSLLRSYRLLLKVRVIDCSDEYAVAVAPYEEKVGGIGHTVVGARGAVLFQDPRDADMWSRAIVPTSAWDAMHVELPDPIEYEILRICRTIPDCVRDMIRGESFPLHFAMDKLHAISASKGCYIGQEVVARMWRTGSRKMLYTVTADTDIPAGGQEVTIQGRPSGRLLSVARNWGLCLLEVGQVTEECMLRAGEIDLKLYRAEGPRMRE